VANGGKAVGFGDVAIEKIVPQWKDKAESSYWLSSI
jgi:hypothetical protein